SGHPARALRPVVRVPRLRSRRLRDRAQCRRASSRRRPGSQALACRLASTMEIDARVEAWASLQLLTGVSARSHVALLKALGSPQSVLEASRATLGKLVDADAAASIARGPDPQQLKRALAWIAEPGHALVAWDDPDYPGALLATADPPPAFYYRGRRELLNRPAFAIVGSRNATPQ